MLLRRDKFWEQVNKVARNLTSQFPPVFVVVAVTTLAACGGSSGGNDVFNDETVSAASTADGIQNSPVTDPPITDPLASDDAPLVCDAGFDTAELLFTEVDRFWSCQIVSDTGTRFDEVFFSRTGTATFGSSGLNFWNRNLPGAEINRIAADGTVSVMRDIQSSNTTLSFETVLATGESEFYDCLLVPRSPLALLTQDLLSNNL